jgi:mannose-6-phosphate isomerase
MKKLTSRRWGHYKVLHFGPNYVVKELVVNPRCGISYQKHNHRVEFWNILRGQAMVRYAPVYAPESYSMRVLGEGASFTVKKQEWHQVWNETSEPLVILEFQVGDCSEEDIERREFYPNG